MATTKEPLLTYAGIRMDTPNSVGPEPGGSSPYSQDPATGPYPERD